MAVSVREVAELAGVSLGTVSNVLNSPSKVTPETAKRVQDAIQQLGYVRNDAARQLRAGSSRTIGLVVLDVRNPFFTDVARGAERRAAESGLGLLLANSDQNADSENNHLDLFEEQRVRGILLSPVGDGLEQLRSRRMPVVLVDRDGNDEMASISVDDVAGGQIAAQHLLDIGRRRIAVVGGTKRLRQVRDRRRGARAIVKKTSGASLELIDTTELSVMAGRDAGLAIAARPAPDRPDGVFAANDLVAIGMLQAFAYLDRVQVPEEIAVVGYDDIDFAQSTVVPLTSVRQPSEEIGRRAVDLLLDELDGASKSHIVLQPELVVRESTARAASVVAETSGDLDAPAGSAVSLTG